MTWLVILESFESVMFLKLWFVTSHRGLPHALLPWRLRRGLQGSWGSQAIQWFRQSTLLHLCRSATAKCILISQAKWYCGVYCSLRRRCPQPVWLEQRRQQRSHDSVTMLLQLFSLVLRGWYCLGVQYSKSNNCLLFWICSVSTPFSL